MWLFLFTSALYAASLDCNLQPPTALIGEELTYSLRVNGAAGQAVRVLWPEDGDFQLLAMDSAEYAKSGAFNFLVAVYDTGHYQLHGVSVIVGSGAAAETLAAPPQAVTIQPSLPDSAAAIKANKRFRDQPFHWRELLEYWWIAAVLATLAAAYWVWRRYFRKVADDAAAREPELPPAEQAIRDLILLRDQRYPARGMLKEFYSDYSHILRNYLERRYGFPALEMTTFDLEYEFVDPRFPPDFRTRLLPVLRESDLVKFAKFLPIVSECEQHIELGFELVTLTKPVETEPKPAVPKDELKDVPA